MNRKYRLVTLLILTLCFFPKSKLYCESNLEKQKQKFHAIKIVSQINRWNKWAKPFKIEESLKFKLKDMGFKLFPGESDSWDATIYVDYSETRAVLLRSGGKKLGYSSDILCSLKLRDEKMGLLFEKSIEWCEERLSPATIKLVSKLPRNQYEVYEQNITSFRNVIYWKYLDRFLLSRLSGGDELQVLTEILRDDSDPEFRMKAANELGKIGGARAVDSLMNALDDPGFWYTETYIKQTVVQYVIAALGDIKDTKAVDPLITILGGKDNNRAYAAQALGKIGDRKAIVPLVAALKGKDSYVREKAAYALDNLNWKPKTFEQRAYYLVAKRHWQKIIQLGTTAVPALINTLDGSGYQQKMAWALGEIGDVRAIKPLKELTKNGIRENREAARQALQKIVQENSVAVAQWALAILGYDPGPSDGIMGKQTFNAIKKFQRDNNLQENGHLTRSLVSKLQDQVEEKQEKQFIGYSNGVVYDKNTGLEWFAGPDKDTNWYDAKNWVDSLTAFAGGGWRMPTRGEVRTLYKKGAGTYNMTPLLETTGWKVWSGETERSSSAWYFDFREGSAVCFTRGYYYGRGFAVRSRR